MSRVQYFCTQRKEVDVTENEIRARNALVLAARNAGEQDARDRLSKMKGVKLGKRGKRGSGDQPYTAMRLKTEFQRRIAREAEEQGLTISRYVEIVFTRWWAAPAKQKMIGKFLDAVREYEREVNNGQEKS